MAKKVTVLILSLLLVLSAAFMITSCGEKEPKHTHEFSEVWSSDETYHWHACKGEDCNEVQDKGEHEYVKGVCVCGKKEPVHEHTYSEAWTYNETYHWHASTCGHDSEISGKDTHDYAIVVTGPTCTEKGYTTYTCKVCGYSFKSDYVNAKGHEFSKDWSKNESGHWHDAICGHDGEKSNFSAHHFEVKKVVNPNCIAEGYTEYECSDCGFTYKGDQKSKIPHEVEVWEETGATLFDGTCCKYAVEYSGECKNCHQIQTKTEYIVRHELCTEIVSEATCVSQGTRRTYCKNCPYSQDMLFDAPEGTDCHHWVVKSSGNGITEYVCDNEGCTVAPKTIVSAKESTNVDVTGEQLDAISEIELETATIALSDEVKETLKGAKKDIKVSATTLDEQELDQAKQSLSPEDLEKLKDNPVYDFSFVASGEQEGISALGGNVSIRIPYDVTGKDPDNIIVFYMNSGVITPIKAVYANGYVSFVTDHFSMYTVAEILPEEYCEYYGEHGELHVVAPTCTTGGYTVCVRCGEIIETTEAKGHVFQSEVKSECTCTQNGVIEYKCKNCEESYEEILPAKGHNYVIAGQVNATCSSAGSVTYRCSNCGDEYVVTIPQTEHNFITETVLPTCTEKGYTVKTCPDCGEKVYVDYVDATGHIFGEEWSADKDGHYHVCSVCGEKGENHNHIEGAPATETTAKTCTECGYVLEAPIGHIHANHVDKIDRVEADCLTAGNIEYFVCECGEWFFDEGCTNPVTDKNSVIIKALGHEITTHAKVDATCTEVGYTEGQWCERCKRYVGGHVEIPKKGHNYTKVVTAPTCTEEGYTTYTCACGDSYIGDIVPAREHDYVLTVTAPTCTEQGFTTFTCKYCSHTYKDEYTEKLGHDYVGVVTNPTCTDGGFTTYTCSRCSDSYVSDYTEKLGHLWAEEFKFNETYHWHECKRCDETSEKCAHNPDYVSATEEHGITCTECGYAIASALGHIHANHLTKIDKVDAGCLTAGNIEYYVCDCGTWFFDVNATKVITDHDDVIIGKLGHDYVGVVTNPTCTDGGFTTYTCSRCSDSYVSDYTETVDHVYEDGKCIWCEKEEGQEGEVKLKYVYEMSLTQGEVTVTYTFNFYTDYSCIVVISLLGESQQEDCTWNVSEGIISVEQDGMSLFKFVENEDGKTLKPYEKETKVLYTAEYYGGTVVVYEDNTFSINVQGLISDGEWKQVQNRIILDMYGEYIVYEIEGESLRLLNVIEARLLRMKFLTLDGELIKTYEMVLDENNKIQAEITLEQDFAYVFEYSIDLGETFVPYNEHDVGQIRSEGVYKLEYEIELEEYGYTSGFGFYRIDNREKEVTYRYFENNQDTCMEFYSDNTFVASYLKENITEEYSGTWVKEGRKITATFNYLDRELYFSEKVGNEGELTVYQEQPSDRQVLTRDEFVKELEQREELGRRVFGENVAVDVLGQIVVDGREIEINEKEKTVNTNYMVVEAGEGENHSLVFGGCKKACIPVMIAWDFTETLIPCEIEEIYSEYYIKDGILTINYNGKIGYNFDGQGFEGVCDLQAEIDEYGYVITISYAEDITVNMDGQTLKTKVEMEGSFSGYKAVQSGEDEVLYTGSTNFSGMDLVFNLYEGGKATVIVMSTEMPCSWRIEGEVITVIFEGMEFKFTVEEGVLVPYQEDLGELIYVGYASIDGEDIVFSFYEDGKAIAKILSLQMEVPCEWSVKGEVVTVDFMGMPFMFTIVEGEQTLGEYDPTVGQTVLYTSVYAEYDARFEFYEGGVSVMIYGGQPMPSEWTLVNDEYICSTFMGMPMAFTFNEGSNVLTYISDMSDTYYYSYRFNVMNANGETVDLIPIEEYVTTVTDYGEDAVYGQVLYENVIEGASFCVEMSGDGINFSDPMMMTKTLELGKFYLIIRFQGGGVSIMQRNANEYDVPYFRKATLNEDGTLVCAREYYVDFEGYFEELLYGTWSEENGVVTLDLTDEGYGTFLFTKKNNYESQKLISVPVREKILYTFGCTEKYITVRLYENGLASYSDWSYKLTFNYSIDNSEGLKVVCGENIAKEFFMDKTEIEFTGTDAWGKNYWTVGGEEEYVTVENIYLRDGNEIAIGKIKSVNDLIFTVQYSDRTQKFVSYKEITVVRGYVNVNVKGSYSLTVSYEGYQTSMDIVIGSEDEILDVRFESNKVIWLVDKNGNVIPDLDNFHIEIHYFGGIWHMTTLSSSVANKDDVARIRNGKSGDDFTLRLNTVYGDFDVSVKLLSENEIREKAEYLDLNHYTTLAYKMGDTELFNTSKVYVKVTVGIETEEEVCQSYSYYKALTIEDLDIPEDGDNIYNKPGLYEYAIKEIYGKTLWDRTLDVVSFVDESEFSQYGMFTDSVKGNPINLPDMKLGESLDEYFEKLLESFEDDGIVFHAMWHKNMQYALFETIIEDITLDMFDYSNVDATTTGNKTAYILIPDWNGNLCPFSITFKIVK